MYPLKKQKVFEEMDNMTVVKFTQEPNIYASQWKLAGGPIQKKMMNFTLILLLQLQGMKSWSMATSLMKNGEQKMKTTSGKWKGPRLLMHPLKKQKVFEDMMLDV